MKAADSRSGKNCWREDIPKHNPTNANLPVLDLRSGTKLVRSPGPARGQDDGSVCDVQVLQTPTFETVMDRWDDGLGVPGYRQFRVHKTLENFRSPSVRQLTPADIAGVVESMFVSGPVIKVPCCSGENCRQSSVSDS